MARKKTPPGWLKVGDRVVSNEPGIDWTGVVVEDRGALAINGSQIVAIRLDYAPALRSSRSAPKNSNASLRR